MRPPLVIKALLDMKGEALGETRAQPLTLGMLERLEGIVKVRDQMKFNVHQGREYLIYGVFVLLFFSFAQFMWEFTKVLTYQNRFFSKVAIAQIDAASNLPMYWPATAYSPVSGGGPSLSWDYHPGGAGCQATVKWSPPWSTQIGDVGDLRQSARGMPLSISSRESRPTAPLAGRQLTFSPLPP